MHPPEQQVALTHRPDGTRSNRRSERRSPGTTRVVIGDLKVTQGAQPSLSLCFFKGAEEVFKGVKEVILLTLIATI